MGTVNRDTDRDSVPRLYTGGWPPPARVRSRALPAFFFIFFFKTLCPLPIVCRPASPSRKCLTIVALQRDLRAQSTAPQVIHVSHNLWSLCLCWGTLLLPWHVPQAHAHVAVATRLDTRGDIGIDNGVSRLVGREWGLSGVWSPGGGRSEWGLGVEDEAPGHPSRHA